MGGKTGSNASIGAGLGILAGLALAPVTGGASLALAATAGASLGAGGGAVTGMASDAKAAQRKMTAEMNNATRQEQKPTIPTQDSEAIRASRNMRALQLSQRSGRASTFLTDKFGG